MFSKFSIFLFIYEFFDQFVVDVLLAQQKITFHLIGSGDFRSSI